jgi:hypothetical protein
LHYDFDITVPANTSADAPLETEVALTHGIITRVELDFHPGAAGLLHVQMWRGLHQVWPTNPQASFHANARVIPWDEYYDLTEIPYLFTIKAWNLDDTYPHEVIVSFAELEEDIAMPPNESLPILKRLSRYFFGAAISIINSVRMWR